MAEMTANQMIDYLAQAALANMGQLVERGQIPPAMAADALIGAALRAAAIAGADWDLLEPKMRANYARYAQEVAEQRKKISIPSPEAAKSLIILPGGRDD